MDKSTGSEQPIDQEHAQKISLAKMLSTLMIEAGYDPNNNQSCRKLAFQARLSSENTIIPILKGKTRKPHSRTLENLIKVLCPNQPDKAQLLRDAANRPQPSAPPE